MLHRAPYRALVALLLVAACLSGCPPQVTAKPPEVFFGAQPLSGPAPLNVRFTDTSDLKGETLVSRVWGFGDGATSTDEEPRHPYAMPGLYTVTLTVTTSGGSNTLTRTDYIEVRPTVDPVEGEGEGLPEGEGAVDGEGSIEGSGEGEGSTEGVAEEPLPGEARTFLDEAFVWIPSGSFSMGTDRTAEELEDLYGDRAFYFRSEQPAHTVTLSQGFWMASTEVTQKFWLRYRTENPSLTVGDDRPVERVSWQQALDFTQYLSTLGQGTFRLPTEAEWERACRAGTSTEFSYGDDPAQLPDYGWFFDNTLFTTKPVAQRLPNPWGLYDIHGNVFEWCSDWYGQTYYAESPATDPPGPATGDYKVRRGGSYSRTDAFCRSAFRLWNGPEDQLEFIGLRLVRDAD
jgi:sulfatase modifying factor 1